ncbi:hypothetical protein [Psychromonas sp. GE-S-Ul-11]|uniref:hypothetical protein n=1 Tax=Psychromonas sp. GE-S-Ul-11 TaxID=3241170 RepID=UPI00390C4912
MTNIGINHYNTNLKVAQPQNIQSKEAEATKEVTAVTVTPAENKHVELSAKAKELSAAEIAQTVKPEEEGTSKVESFAHGMLGMDHPEKGKEEDDSYSAGQFLKGALSVGALLLAVV